MFLLGDGNLTRNDFDRSEDWVGVGGGEMKIWWGGESTWGDFSWWGGEQISSSGGGLPPSPIRENPAMSAYNISALMLYSSNKT